MKKLIVGIMCLALVACAGVGIKLSDSAITVLQSSATSTVGYLIAKNNPSRIDDMVAWYNAFKGVSDLSGVQGKFKDGMAKLTELVSDDPYLQLQIRNAMNLIEISVEGPTTEIDIGKYQAVVDSFMSGVVAARIVTSRINWQEFNRTANRVIEEVYSNL